MNEQQSTGMIASIVRGAIEKKTVTTFAVILVIIAGILSYFRLGQLEDPEFAVKTAIIMTQYPGASPEEVEKEVSDRIETAIQEMPELRYVRSYNSAGVSLIKVDIQESYTSKELPQIWDKLRKRISDVKNTLPPGVMEPNVSDDSFGEVYGHVLAITGEGYSYAEMEQYAKMIKREMSMVDGVARVELWGAQPKAVYVDASDAKMASLGITSENVLSTLNKQNMIVNAGYIESGNSRFRIETKGSFKTPEEIAELMIHAPATGSTKSTSGQNLVRLGDIATISTGYMNPPRNIMHYNGISSIAVSISTLQGVNVVDLGGRIEAKIKELQVDIPRGIEFHRIAWQADLVSSAIDSFMRALMEATVIVVGLLWLTMGWRMAFVTGTALALSVLGTMIFMAVLDINLQRISLGALVIALGMIVDNAIVVAENAVVRMQNGQDRLNAFIDASARNSWPLLGGTLIAILAFYPIFAAASSTGEFCATLFIVIAISLLLSWVFSITYTPLQGVQLLKAHAKHEGEKDSKVMIAFESLLKLSLKYRYAFVLLMVGALIASIYGFGYVKKNFFPDASRPQFIVQYWGDKGTRIQNTEEIMRQLEEKALQMENVSGVATFIGGGGPRFYLPISPEEPDPAYGELVVNVDNFEVLNKVYTEYKAWAKQNIPGLVLIKKYSVGPSDTWKFEWRLSGPPEADPEVLRGIAAEGVAILNKSPLVDVARTDWRNKTPKYVVEYDQKRGRWTGVTRDDVAIGIQSYFDGNMVGLYRENDDLYPIILRNENAKSGDTMNLVNVQVKPSNSTKTVPLEETTSKLVLEYEDPIINRFDRKRAITVQANPIDGVTFPTLWASIQKDFEAIELPPGYTYELDGEFESSDTANKSLIPGVLPAVILMIFIIVALFNEYRPLLVILLVVPFAIIGMTIGLIAFDTAFGFMALLGAMSLSGMMIRNAIVLIDEINLNKSQGRDGYDAVVNAAKVRLRPVLLTATAASLGLVPLLHDVFWVGMSVTIMFGLLVGTVITMFFVPVAYAIAYRLYPKVPKNKENV